MRRRLRLLALLLAGLATTAGAAGNFPEAGSCPPERPYYAFCTHSLHNLEGWYSRECRRTREEAEADARRHAERWHHGNMRWTGVAKSR